MKVLVILVLMHATLGRVFDVYSKLPKSHKLARKLARKLYLDDLNLNLNSYQSDQMETTNTNTHQMEGHNRRTAQMRQISSWFGDVDMAVDDFRDVVSRKLDQLNMSLQRPKLPVMGMMNGVVPPANFASGSSLGGASLSAAANQASLSAASGGSLGL